MFKVITESLNYIPKRISEKAALELIETKDPWISSDYHLFRELRFDNGHFANNLFKESEQQTQQMIGMHQSIVRDNDVFLYLGDLSESELETREDYQEKLIKLVNNLNGIKILIKGNNDTMSNEFYYKCGFIYVWDDIPVFSQKLKVVFSHEPYDICSSQLEPEWINIHGHLHMNNDYWNMDWKRHVNVYPKRYNMSPVKLGTLRTLYNQNKISGTTVYRQQL